MSKRLTSIKRAAGRHWVGNGFPVRSVFSYDDSAIVLSPFLLLDYGGPASFPPAADGERRGVGAHPHRGFETVTVVYQGEVEHRDSTGAGGRIGPGDVQWMTAGAGIVHEEFHGTDYARRGGPFQMVQLWVNLPAKDKLVAPGYQGITAAQIPAVDLPGGAGRLRVIAGRYGDAQGPARTHSPVSLWDLQVRDGRRVELAVPAGHTAALLVMEGALRTDAGESAGEAEVALFERDGGTLAFTAEGEAKLLFLGGEPIAEPVVGRGPFVMNTPGEIAQAFADFQSGRMGRMPEPA